jgi:lipid-A-disaccharide synthase
MALRIGIVAAEPSGDLLAGGLMAALRERVADVEFEGIGGERMAAHGLKSRVPLEKLSVMGLVEVLKHLPELLRIRRGLVEHWLANPPDLFIGVDAPDFNLGLEEKLKAAGIPTVHYVCPTVWAWRPGRVKLLRRATDLILSIFPFEPAFLEQHGVNSRYIGHTLAREMPLEPDREAARAALGLPVQGRVLALLPGSRRSEIEVLSRPFLQAVGRLKADYPELQVIVPLANERGRELFAVQHARHAVDLPLKMVVGRTQEALAAADLALVASGTATLEGLLSKRPMVIGYKVHWLTYLIVKAFRLVRLENYSMANLLAGERLAPEYLQGACEPEQLAPALQAILQDPERIAGIQQRYREIHQGMIRNTNAEAAAAVLELLSRREAGHD